MTDENSDSNDGKLRRTFMREGAVASGGLALGLSAAGSVSAQDGGILDGNAKGLISSGNVYPAARFVFVSGVVEWTPNYGDIRDSWFSDFNTYMIRWLNTGNVVPFWVAEEADVGQFDSDLGFVTDDEDQSQPRLYEMEREFTPFGDNPRLTEVEFSAIDQEEEDAILENEDWWQEGDGGGPGDGMAGNESTGNQSDVV